MKPNFKKNKSNHWMILSVLICLTFFFACKNDEPDPDPEPEEEPVVIIDEDEYVDKSCASCAYVIEAGEWQFDGAKFDLSPGDTIGIVGGEDGTRDGLSIINVVGSKDQPIVFINCDGRVELGKDKWVSKGIDVESSQYFRIAGTGSTEHPWGIAVRGFMGLEVRGVSSDYEIFKIEVLEAGYAGVTCRTDAACDGSVGIDFTQYNTVLHDNYIHDTGGEGVYIGGSHWNKGQLDQPGCEGTLIWEPQLIGVEVYNNFVKNTGRDGIQVGSAIQDCKIYNNVILDYGLAEDEGHVTGFQINPGTTGELYNNVIVGGKGFGIFCVGQGGNTIYNNLIINPLYDGVYVDERLQEDSDREWYFRIINNTIINPGYNGVGFNSGNTVGNVIINNIVTTPGNKFFDGWDNFTASGNLLTDTDSLEYINSFSNQTSVTDLLKLDYSAFNIPSGKDVSEYGIDEDIRGLERQEGEVTVGAFQ